MGAWLGDLKREFLRFAGEAIAAPAPEPTDMPAYVAHKISPSTLEGQAHFRAPVAEDIASSVSDAMGLSVSPSAAIEAVQLQDAQFAGNSTAAFDAHRFQGDTALDPQFLAQKAEARDADERDELIGVVRQMLGDRALQDQAELDALLQSLTPEQIREVGKRVAEDYAEKERLALERGDFAAAGRMHRLEVGAELYSQYLREGLTPAEARAKLQGALGYDSNDAAELNNAFGEKVHALGMAPRHHFSYAEEVASPSEARSTSLGASLLGDSSRAAPLLQELSDPTVEPANRTITSTGSGVAMRYEP